MLSELAAVCSRRNDELGNENGAQNTLCESWKTEKSEKQNHHWKFHISLYE